MFTRGATFTESTINSTLSGYGAFYRETWVDCDYCDDKSVFGIATVSGSSYFDIYESSAYCGDMTSVVINGNYANNVSVNESMGSVQNILLIPADDAYNGTNCVKVVSNFNDYNQFVGSFTFNYAYNKLYNNYRTATQELTFDIGTVWQNNNGIGLIFLNNIQ